MNFAIPFWAKALVLIVLLAGSFGLGVVTESRWEIKATHDLILKQEEAARLEREALASALTGKMETMTRAALESANLRTNRERALEATNSQLLQQAQDHVTNNNACLDADAATVLDGVRKRPAAPAGKPK